MKRKVIGIIGLGYVGLPLAIKFINAGFHVIGIDNDVAKLKSIISGKSYIDDIGSKELKDAYSGGKFNVSGDYSSLRKTDVICICVPTPLDKNKQPDMSYVEYATEKISKILRKGQLVILESTTYPGTTEEVLLPVFERTGLKVGRDFNLVFSPERVDPGNKKFRLNDIPKVIGGVTEKCSAKAAEVYGMVFKNIHIVSSPKVAEMEKLLENIFRSVNIALVNELSMLCRRMGIDVWEVIEAAKTKPYGYMAFYPGPGIGGHCIPLDPFYLSWKAKEYGIGAKFIELSGEINDSMPDYTVNLIQEKLNKQKKCLKGAKILALGVAYKKDIADTRESPAIKVISRLLKEGSEVSYADPLVPIISVNGRKIRAKSIGKRMLSGCDCVLILTDHSCFDYHFIYKHSKMILDTKNALKCIGPAKKKVVKI